MALTKIHLVNPRTGQRKWYLLASPMVFFFAGFFFSLITRKLWGWVAVYVGLWILSLTVVLLTDGTPDAAAASRVLNLFGLGMATWAALVANKQATRFLLDQGWIVSPETTPAAWAAFQKKWKLPDSAQPHWPAATATRGELAKA